LADPSIRYPVQPAPVRDAIFAIRDQDGRILVSRIYGEEPARLVARALNLRGEEALGAIVRALGDADPLDRIREIATRHLAYLTE
jgi:hypothetical protein